MVGKIFKLEVVDVRVRSRARPRAAFTVPQVSPAAVSETSCTRRQRAQTADSERSQRAGHVQLAVAVEGRGRAEPEPDERTEGETKRPGFSDALVGHRPRSHDVGRRAQRRSETSERSRRRQSGVDRTFTATTHAHHDRDKATGSTTSNAAPSLSTVAPSLERRCTDCATYSKERTRLSGQACVIL